MSSSKAARLFFATAVALLSFWGTTVAQEQVHSGRPLWRSFDTRDTGAAQVTRQAHADSNGIVYAANDAGLLIFDGASWDLFPAGERQLPVHALAPLDNGQWIAGGPDGLGLFSPHPVKGLTWRPIDDQTADNSNFDSIIGFSTAGDRVLALTDRSVVTVNDSQVTELLSDAPTGLMMHLGSRTLINTSQGLFSIEGDSPVPIETPPGWSDQEPIDALHTSEGNVILATRRSGLFQVSLADDTLRLQPMWSSLPGPLASERLSAAVTLESGSYLIGTESGTLLHLLSDGTVALNMGKAAGFRAGPIRSLVNLKDGSVLVFHDGGAFWIDPHAPIRVWDHKNGLHAPPRAAVAEDVTTFIGTDDGLFRTTAGHRVIAEPGAGTESIHLLGRFSRSAVRGHVSLLIGRADGLFDYYDNRMTSLTSQTPSDLQVSTTQPSRIAVSSDQGITLFSYTDGDWESAGTLLSSTGEGVVALNETPEGHLVAVGSAGTIWLYAPDQWLAASINGPPPPLNRQETARRFQSDERPFFSDASDQLRVYLTGTPLVWSAPDSGFTLDVDLSLDLSQIAGPYFAAATTRQVQWVQTGRGVVALDSSNQQGTYITLPRFTGGTGPHHGFLQDPTSGRLLILSPEGLFTRHNTVAALQDDSSERLPVLIRRASTNGVTIAQSLNGITEIELSSTDRSLTLAIATPASKQRCRETMVGIVLAGLGRGVRSSPLSRHCEVTIDIPTNMSAAVELELFTMANDEPASAPTTLTVHVSVPWFASGLIPLSLGLLSAAGIAALRSSPIREWSKPLIKPMVLMSGLCLLWAGGLFFAVLPRSLTIQVLSLHIGLVALAAVVMSLLTYDGFQRSR